MANNLLASGKIQKNICPLSLKYLSALLVFLFYTLSSTAQNNKNLPKYVDSILNTLVTKNKIPGGIVSVVENGNVIYSASVGLRNISLKQKTDSAQTSFRIASVTKIFTTLTILKLADAGKLSLDADQSDNLRKLGVRFQYNTPVTFRHLLTHTSGLDNSDINDASLDSNRIVPLKDFCKINRVVQIHKPGSTWHYSNAGMTVAGALAEKITGIEFSKLISHYILQPLEMNQTHFKHFDHNWAVGYEENNNQFYPVPYEYPNTYPAGGITSTIADMSKFMKGILNDSLFLSVNMRNELFKPQFAYNEQSGQSLGFQQSLYGTKLNTIGTTRIYRHSGSRPGFASLLVMIPEKGIAIFISLNARENSSCSFIANNIINKFYQGNASASAVMHSTSLNLKEYNGTYVQVNVASGTIEKFSLFLKKSRYKEITALGNDSLSLAKQYTAYPKNKDTFRLAGSNRIITFIRDEKGEVKYAALDLNKFRKIAWYESVGFNRWFFVTIIIFFLLWSIYAVVKIIKKRRRESSHITAFITSVIGLLVPLYIIVAVSNAPEQLFDYGVPFFIKVIPGLILLQTVGFTSSLFFYIKDLKKSRYPLWHTVFYLIFVMMTTVVLFWYDHFNLVGFQY
jgi:CubicO group peptidase (beta-lactamase class C family)